MSNQPLKLKKLTRPILLTHLESVGLEDVDHTLIEELFFNIKLMNEAKESLEDEGHKVNVSSAANTPVYQRNPSVNVYKDAIAEIQKISKLFGLSPKDRKELTTKKVEVEDGF